MSDELITTDAKEALDNTKKNYERVRKEANEVKLPRPLKDGEFYCHLCEKFVPMAKHAEHNKECRLKVRKECGK